MRSRPGNQIQASRCLGAPRALPLWVVPSAGLGLPVGGDSGTIECRNPLPYRGSPRHFRDCRVLAPLAPPGKGTRSCGRCLGRRGSAGPAGALGHGDGERHPKQALSPEFILETEAPALSKCAWPPAAPPLSHSRRALPSGRGPPAWAPPGGTGLRPTGRPALSQPGVKKPRLSPVADGNIFSGRGSRAQRRRQFRSRPST
ncbi:uncharacterized protein LOC118931055 [Manis pentadactyla]|uniref:uncharacterized protein LOC118931055 n=1 Tax=Manis pentadactyla TaxID=143292 RepID=UPI00255C6CE1|nr:uncharacterized protein LOC118931055 [Manis pentadactyla]